MTRISFPEPPVPEEDDEDEEVETDIGGEGGTA